MELTHEYTIDIGHRFRHIKWIIATVFLIIVGRLYYLQVVKGNYYHFFSEQNSIKEIKIPALRGNIYDRNGKTLVENRAAFDITVTPQYIKDHDKLIGSLSQILKMAPEDIEALLAKGKGLPSYYPIAIKEDASFEDVASIKAYKTPWSDDNDPIDIRGVDVQMRYARFYPDSLAASHLLGYIKEIDANRLKSYDEKSFGSYKMGDFIGIGGVEELWDISLRGRDGFDQRVVNAIGREVIWPDIELIHEKPEDGASLKLTVDADLQVAAKEALAGKSGAVVAIDPRNGDVLALYSAPSIDLNRLSSSEGGAYWQKLAVDPEKPVYSRAIQGSYPPGSTYKIVTATSALGEKEITPTDNLFCGGGMNYGGRFYSCWRKGGHGSIDIKMALTASCDTFFYQLGLKLGVDRIAKYANLMGLGKITGIDVPGEKSGLIPTSAWKEETRKVKWQAGENLSIAVGQGYDTVTPLQNAVMISTIANGGKKVTPHVTSSVIDSTGKEIFRWSEEQFPQVLSEEDVNVIKRGLEGVVDSPFGTGNRLKALGLKIAGKTGTAQVVAKEVWRSGEAEMKDHAWFVGYAPYDNPVIAVAAVVEHGGFGASAAAPVVGKIIETYLKKENK